MPREKKTSYTAPALEKGLDIIELLSREETGLPQSAIAQSLGRSTSEIYRMLVVLLERGYIAQEPLSDRYVLTTFIFELAHRIPKLRRLTALAAPMMRGLASRINQSVHLTVLSEGGILVVGQVDSPGDNTMAVRLGARIDLFRASSGLVILAHLDETELSAILSKSTLPDGMTEQSLRADLHTIRAAGCEIRNSYVVQGVVNISAPILDHTGCAIGALTIPHIVRYHDTVTQDQCRAELLDTTAELSRSLGRGAARVARHG